MACKTAVMTSRELPDGRESPVDGLGDHPGPSAKKPAQPVTGTHFEYSSSDEKQARGAERNCSSKGMEGSTYGANLDGSLQSSSIKNPEENLVHIGRQHFDKECERRCSMKKETAKLLEQRGKHKVDQKFGEASNVEDIASLEDATNSINLQSDQRTAKRVPQEQTESGPMSPGTRSSPTESRPAVPVSKAADGVTQIVPGIQLKGEPITATPSEPQDKFADPLVKDIITNNTIFMDRLCRCLDRESRVIKCWRHLAFVLAVPADVSRKFDMYTERSPTEDLFFCLPTWQPDLTVGKLKDILKDIYRNDIVESLKQAKYYDNDAVCDLVLGRPEFLTLLASQLDIESRTIGNWKSLATKFGFPKSKIDQFGMPRHGPTDLLFEYLSTTGEHKSLTVGQLKAHLKTMGRMDVLQIFDKFSVDDSSLTKDILKPDSELLDEIGQKLNKEIRALKGWRNLAYRLGIPTDVYTDFDVAKKKAKSATRMLFEWLMRRRSDLSIDDLLKALKEIDRNDVIELVKEETALAAKRASETPKYRTTTQLYNDLKEMKEDTSRNSKSYDDRFHMLRKNAAQKGYQIRCDNPGGGNCMFYALVDQLRRVNYDHITHDRLRQNLVQYLEGNSKLADGTELVKFARGYERWSDYLKEMGKDGTWGDHIMLIAAANSYRRPIKVITSLPHNKGTLIMPVQVPDEHVVDNPLVLGHIAEDHYVSLEPVQGAPQNGQGTLKASSEMPRSGYYNEGSERALSTGNPCSRTSGAQLKIPREEKLKMRPKRLPYSVYGKLCRMLDIKRDFFDDFRMVAEELGIDRDDIRWLEQQTGPTDKILNRTDHELTVEKLMQVLLKIERHDVASILRDWAESDS